MRDSTLLNAMVGAAITNAGAAVQFWIGSSSGSQKKDDIIAAGNLGSGKPEQPIAIAVNQAAPTEPH